MVSHPHIPAYVTQTKGISLTTRSQAYKRRALFKRNKPAIAPAKQSELTQAAGFYPAEDICKPKASRKSTPATQKLRASITPGTVLILLAGRFRGKRVVFLKQLSSGLLLVTGPYKVNGVPLRRVNQAYVIATSTKVNIQGVNVEKISDDYFKCTEKKKEGDEKKEISKERVQDQKTVDSAILKVLKKETMLRKYLNASFALSKGQFPHNMKF